MSEQQLARIDGRLDRVEGRLDRVEGRLDTIGDDVGVLKTDVGVLKTDVGVLKTAVGGLQTAVGGLQTSVGRLEAGMTGLENRLEEVDRHMGVLFEELVDRIKALDRDDGTRLEMRRTVAEVRSELAEHVTSDSDAHRHFAESVREHAQRLTRLEGRRKQ
jgi:chromosome segregation ATPase